jgi:hypothetical protein
MPKAIAPISAEPPILRQDVSVAEHPGLTLSMASVFETIPAELIDKTLGATARRGERSRLYPNDAMFLLPVIMGLLMDEAYDEAYKQFSLAANRLGYDVPPTANNQTIVNIRGRLGFEPYKYVFDELNLRHDVSHPSCYWNELRVQCLDASYIDIEDSAENCIFPKSKTGTKEGAYPQLIAVTLVDYGTRLAKDVELGTRCTNELIIAEPLLRRLQKGTLCTADRQYPSFWSIEAATTNGAEILWRVTDSFKLDPVKYFDDGSYLARVYEYDDTRHRTGHSREVRVIAYTVENMPTDEQQSEDIRNEECQPNTKAKDESTSKAKKTNVKAGKNSSNEASSQCEKNVIRLVTSILDPTFASAEQLASLYPLRYYTSEGFYRELKTVLRGTRKVLRSKSPAFVAQEIYGLLLAHWITRWAIVKAAEKHEKLPLRLSFTNAVRVIRRTMIRNNDPSVPSGTDSPPGGSV